jgi:hypothetical protein
MGDSMKIKGMSKVVFAFILAGSTAIWAKKDPGFSLHNKAGKAIWVTVNNDQSLGKKVEGFFTTKANKVTNKAFYDKDIKTNKETELIVFDDNENELVKATFTKDMTIYVNWDGKKLYPQRGPLKGVLGKVSKKLGLTDQGYSLANNVTEDDITVQ